MPTNWTGRSASETVLDLLGEEIAAEKAASLGRAWRKAESVLRSLAAHAGAEEERSALVASASEAVYAYFVQRELCGMRRHDDVIRDLSIPKEVLVRLGAR